MAGVVLKDVCKVYDGGGTTLAVNHVNLTIKDREFMVLVGPSGCGKSTTLRMIAGLEEISSGTISIGDRVVNNVPPKDRDIAMVFQNYALYPHKTVYENMAFGLRLRKFPKADIDKRVRAAAEILGIESFLNRKPLSCASRKCSCSTNRFPILTQRCASRCVRRSANSIRVLKRR